VAERRKSSSPALGRGLAAILTSTTTAAEDAAELRDLPVDLIAPNPHQPRRHFDEEALVGLADSLRERGVLQPVLVRPVAGGTYELVAGERRWRAARLAGFETVPALVRAHDDAASIEVALIENMAREDLNPVEEARACSVLVEELGLTREEIGKRVGRSRVAVSNLMRLLDLPDEALDLLESGALSEGHGRALLTAPDHADRRRLARAAADEGWTVRHTEAMARERATGDPEPAQRAARRSLHPDQADAVERMGEAFRRALGSDVRVVPAGDGYRVSLAFDSVDDALELAERLQAGRSLRAVS
jgi:ParB family chromosome partitioning protein